MKYIAQNYVYNSILLLLLAVSLSAGGICNAQNVSNDRNSSSASESKQAAGDNKSEKQKSVNPFTKAYKYWFPSKDEDKSKDTAAKKSGKNASAAPDIHSSARGNVPESMKPPKPEKVSWYGFGKKTEENSVDKKGRERELDDSIDKGLEEIALLEQERSFSEKDYVDSAVKSSKAAAKNDYTLGLQLEEAGDFEGAVRSYNNFIGANKKQTANGTLAAPYHRLALLSWKQKEWDKADVYFRYGQRYAQGGNIAIISGDYSLFLMEQGKHEQAEVILRNTLLHFPKDSRLLICLGRCIARQDRPIEALRYLTMVMSEEQACHELAGLYNQIGDYKSAQAMSEKRNILIARRNTTLAHGSPQNPASKPSTMHAAVYPAGTMPYPVISSEQNSFSTSGSWVDAQPSPTDFPQNTNFEQAIPYPSGELRGEGVVQEIQTVTKVYHYPANSPSPVYHQYAGNSYPKMAPVQVQAANNPKDVKNYWASTVPVDSDSANLATIPTDPFLMYPPPLPEITEQRVGYPPFAPPVSSYPQGNVR